MDSSIRASNFVSLVLSESHYDSRFDELRSILASLTVIPVKTGIQESNNKMKKQPAVYILASAKNGTLYTGVTSDLVKRIWEHKNNLVDGFTKRYGVHDLVSFELHDTMDFVIIREKNIKEWKRAWKLKLIEKDNPDWRDLYIDMV